MVISQTPLRVSFFGGGTDIKDYYCKHEGVILSATINRYIYVIVKARCDDKIVLNYSKKEQVCSIEEIEHKIIRECLRIAGINKGIEITSISDIPSEGSGLGSSSSFTVGLLNALFAYKGELKGPHELAEMACRVEIDILKEPIGKQDQYAAAFGGFKKYTFHKDEKVTVEDVKISDRDYQVLNSYSLMFFTGIQRKASTVLTDQKENIGNNIEALNRLKEFAISSREVFCNLDVHRIADMMDVSWEEKKKLSKMIHNNEINSIYDCAKAAGVLGGKLLGAGGGGFYLFLCPPEKQADVRKALKEFKELPFKFAKYGTRIILSIDDTCRFINHNDVAV